MLVKAINILLIGNSKAVSNIVRVLNRDGIRNERRVTNFLTIIDP